MSNEEFLLRVLKCFDECSEGGSHDDIWWRTDGEYAPVTIWVNCSDLFYWGTADLEKITPENLPLLEQTMKDVKAAGVSPYVHGASVFACRSRKMRPQGAVYKDEESALIELFDACGPLRPVDFANPKPQPGQEERK